MEALRAFFYTTSNSNPSDPSSSKRTLNKTRLFATAAVTSIAGGLCYYHSLKRICLPWKAYSSPQGASIDLVVTDTLKASYPDVERLLKEIQKQIQTLNGKPYVYKLGQQSGPPIDLKIIALPKRFLSSSVVVATQDPLLHEQLCDAIQKLVPSQGVTLNIILVSQVAPPVPVSFPAELTLGMDPHPEALLTAIEKQIQRKILVQFYHFYREGKRVRFFIRLPEKGLGFPDDHIRIFMGMKLRSDPFFPLFVDALKTIVYKHTSKYPVFALFYSIQ